MDHTVNRTDTNEPEKLVIANAVPIDPKLVEFIEDRANKLTKELQTLTLNLQQRMAQVSCPFLTFERERWTILFIAI